MSWKLLVAATLALAGCAKTDDPPAETRPDWHGATIDGLAPLMSPRAVETALNRRGYVRVPCVSGDKVIADALYRGTEMPCYRSRGGAMRISLYFLELNEGRRLAVVNFNGASGSTMSDAADIAAGRAIVQRLRTRFGPPAFITKQRAFRTYYWTRPGGSPSLGDMISTTVGATFGANATMTSMWAYGQQRPSS